MIWLPASGVPPGARVADPTGLRRMFRGSAMVTELTILVLLAAFFGAFLDRRLGVSPLFLMLCSCAALVVGLYRIIRWLGTEADGNHPP